MACCVVFTAALCFVSMVTGKLVTNPIPQKYEHCLTNQQCGGKGMTQSVVLDMTTYCCKEGQRLSITTGWDKLLMRLSQNLGKMLFTTLLQKTAPDLARIHSDSRHSQSEFRDGGKSADSSKSDSTGSFSDSESLEKRSDSDSMERRSIPESEDSLEYVDIRNVHESEASLEHVDSRNIPESVNSLDYLDSGKIPESVDSLDYVDSRSIMEYLDRSNGCGNDAPKISRRRLIEERAEMGSKDNREATFKHSLFSNTHEKRAVDKIIQRSPTLLKTTRGDLNIERWIRDYFGTELTIIKNENFVPYNWTAILIYLLNRKYIGHNEKPTRQGTGDISPEIIIEKDEEQIPHVISSELQNRDAEFDYENESSQNRAHDMPRDEVASATFNHQQSLNEIAIRDKRLLNKDPKPGPSNRGLKNTGTGVSNTQATIKGSDSKSNLTNTTKTGAPQAGPASGGKGKQRYFTCKCLPGY